MKKYLVKIVTLCLVLLMVFSLVSCDVLDGLFRGKSQDVPSPAGGADVTDAGADVSGAEKLEDNVLVEGDLSVHFLELGNIYTGRFRR